MNIIQKTDITLFIWWMVNSHSSINTCAHRYTNTQFTCIYRHTWIGAYTYIYASYTSNLTRTRATELNFLSRSDWIEMAPRHFVEKHLTDVARTLQSPSSSLAKLATFTFLMCGKRRQIRAGWLTWNTAIHEISRAKVPYAGVVDWGRGFTLKYIAWLSLEFGDSKI